MSERPFFCESRPHIVVRGEAHDTGAGPVGVFIHGLRSDARGLKATALARHAAARGRSWARFDLAGHGRSDGAFCEQTVSGWLADVLAVIGAYAPRPVVLVGSSLGGWLSVLAARARPERIAGLVLIAPALDFVQRAYETLDAGAQGAWQSADGLVVADAYGGDPYRLTRGLLEDARGHGVLPRPPVLACPLFIVHGARDEHVPLAVSEAFLARVTAPRAELTVVAEGDHRLADGIPAIVAAVDRAWDAAFPEGVS